MNAIDRAAAVLRHAEAHGLGEYLGGMYGLRWAVPHVQLHGGGLASVIAWGRSLLDASAEVSHHKDTVHVNVSGAANAVALSVVVVLLDGPEFDHLTEMAVTGPIELDQLQRFVHEEDA